MPDLTQDWLAERVARLTTKVQAMPDWVECPHWEGSPTGGFCGNIPECAPISNEPRERALALLTVHVPTNIGAWIDSDGAAGEAHDRPRDLWADLSLASWPEWTHEGRVLGWIRDLLDCFGLSLRRVYLKESVLVSVWRAGSLVCRVEAGTEVEAAFEAVERALGVSE